MRNFILKFLLIFSARHFILQTFNPPPIDISFHLSYNIYVKWIAEFNPEIKGEFQMNTELKVISHNNEIPSATSRRSTSQVR